MIRNFLFDHGLKYLYRLHMPKLDRLCKQQSLKNYLLDVPKICPNHLFTQGSRASSTKLKIQADLQEMEGAEICNLAHMATLNKDSRRAHSYVENLFLEQDQKTVSAEVPVWDENLTGHIDLLRIENKKIWILDYKPKAHVQKFAASQIFHYAQMLSKRSELPINNFRCAYFDERKAFAFDPSKVKQV
jgi:ATP-dependent exoDNAse (exonuclease V) beta subunit